MNHHRSGGLLMSERQAMDDNDTPESRRRLSDQEIEEIKKQLLDSIYADIGKSVTISS